ncbi:hypothetical protein OSJ57_26275, partial [Sphingomonas sp. HH69]
MTNTYVAADLRLRLPPFALPLEILAAVGRGLDRLQRIGRQGFLGCDVHHQHRPRSAGLTGPRSVAPARTSNSIVVMGSFHHSEWQGKMLNSPLPKSIFRDGAQPGPADMMISRTPVSAATWPTRAKISAFS